MNKEQVSALSDIELNRAMLNIHMDYWQSDKDILKAVQAGKFNYLTDYNLTMPLAVEHELRIDLYKHEESEAFSFDEIFRSESSNPLRAICEVLVMIQLEAKQ